MSSDLMDRYLDFVRSQGMMPGNKDSLELLKNRLGKNSLNTTKKFEEVKKELVLILQTRKADLKKNTTNLTEGVKGLNDLNEFVNEPNSKGNDPKTSSYPVGYDLSRTPDIYKLLKNYLEDEDPTDIENCANIMRTLFFDNMIYDDAILDYNKDEINNAVKQEKIETEYKQLKKLWPAFRSVLHWSAYQPNQMGIGGPSDLAKLFREFYFGSGNNFDAFMKHSYLDSQILTTAFLLKEASISTRDKYEDIQREIETRVRARLKDFLPEKYLFLNHDIWFKKQVNNGDSDSYVTYMELEQMVESSDGNGAGKQIVGYDNDSGLHNITKEWVAKAKGIAKHHYFIFPKYGRKDNKNVQFKDEDKRHIVYNTCQELRDVIATSDTDCWEENKAGDGNNYQIGFGKPQNIVTKVTTGYNPSKEVTTNQTIQEMKQSGGGKKNRKMKGGVAWGLPEFTRAETKKTTENVSKCGKTGDISTLGADFAIFGDRELFSLNESSKDRYFKNLYKLWNSVKEKTSVEIDKIIQNFSDDYSAPISLPTFYAYDKKDGYLTAPQQNEISGARVKTMEDLAYILAVGNLGVNLGTLLKRLLYKVILAYYESGNYISGEIKVLSNKDNKTRREISKIKDAQDVLWKNLLEKYNNMVKVIDEIFGKVPTANNITAGDSITLAEYFTGVSFTSDGKKCGSFNNSWVERMKELTKIIIEHFPIMYSTASTGSPDQIKEDFLEKKLTELLFKLPEFYQKQFRGVDDNSINIKDIKESREKLALGGMVLINPVMEDVKSFINTLRLAVDSAKRSKESYSKYADRLIEDVQSQITPGAKADIRKGVQEKLKRDAALYRLDVRIKVLQGNLDDDRLFMEHKDLEELYHKIIRKILIDFCGKKDKFIKKYANEIGREINRTEARVGNLATSIYQLKVNTNINKRRTYELDIERERLITEAKAVVLGLYKGYINGLYPLMVVRFTASKIHNIIYDLDNYSMRIVLMNKTRRSNELRRLGYSSSISNDSLAKCMNTNIRPNDFYTTQFWKKKEAIFNKMTRETKNGESYYKRIYCVCLETKVKKLSKDTRHTWDRWWKTFGYEKKDGKWEKVEENRSAVNKLWLVDILALAQKNEWRSLEGKEKISLDKFGRVSEEDREFLGHHVVQKRKVYLGKTLSKAFDLDKTELSQDEHYYEPLILISDNARTNLFNIGLQKGKPEYLRTNKVLYVLTDQNNQLYNPPEDSIRESIYNILFYLPDKFLPNMTNPLKEGLILELRHMGGKYLSNVVDALRNSKKDKKRWLMSNEIKPRTAFLRLLQGLKDIDMGIKYMAKKLGLTNTKIEGGLQPKINKYAAKAIAQLNDFNPFLVNMITGGPIVMPYPFNSRGLGFNPDNYLKNIYDSYKTLGCPMEIQTNSNKKDISEPCIDIETKELHIKPELYEMNRSNGPRGDRLNMQYYEVKTASQRNVIPPNSTKRNASAFIISEENVQKGFGWLEDMNSIADMRLKEESVNVF